MTSCVGTRQWQEKKTPSRVPWFIGRWVTHWENTPPTAHMIELSTQTQHKFQLRNAQLLCWWRAWALQATGILGMSWALFER